MAFHQAFVTPVLLRSIPQVSSKSISLAQRIYSTPIYSRASSIRMTSTKPAETSSPPQQAATAKPKITLLYDSECPLCVKEVNFLRNRSNQYIPPTLGFVDIASANYDPSQYGDISYETAMKRIHAILPDGTILEGVPVFRAAYEAVGLGWVYAITKVPGMGAVAEGLYNIWARYRLQLTGRPPLEQVMEMRRDQVEKGCR